MRIKIVLLVVGLAITGLIAFFMSKKVSAPIPPEQKGQAVLQKQEDEKPPGDIKDFSGQEFSALYNSFVYPNTQKINEHTPITGNPQADEKIRGLAVARGYKLRSAPVTDNFIEVQKTMLLQRPASQPWLDLKNRAKMEGVNLSLSAAYRSAQDQKTIFLQRLNGTAFSDIAAGRADAKVDLVLAKTALPGYSRHHTGYTIDIACDNDPNVKFENSLCFRWLSKNNYQNAKTYGWIPSYPPGAGKQGPDPESWEYVWVGTDILR